MEVQADPYHPFSPTRFRFTSGDAIHVFPCSLHQPFDVPVVTSKTYSMQ